MRSKQTKTPNRSPKKVYAKKSFGQNFLADQNYIRKIIGALDPQPAEIVVEIGAGRGALTEELIASGASVIAIEVEREMIAVLRERFSGKGNFRLVEQDALNVDFGELISDEKIPSFDFRLAPSAKLVANLPYYISTAILQRVIEQRETFSEMVLMFQREVAERITAQPGNSERGFLTVLVEAYLRAEKLFDVPPAAFRPAPKVWSSVLRLTPIKETGIEDDETFRYVVGASFKQKRKTILNNLKGAQIVTVLKSDDHDGDDGGGIAKILAENGIDAERRAESLSSANWRVLSNRLARISKA